MNLNCVLQAEVLRYTHAPEHGPECALSGPCFQAFSSQVGHFFTSVIWLTLPGIKYFDFTYLTYIMLSCYSVTTVKISGITEVM